MLISRIAPPKSTLYRTMADKCKSLDKWMVYQPLSWFGIWTIFAAGMAAKGGEVDRYHYWDWSSFLLGLFTVIVITYLASVLFLKPKRIDFQPESNSFLHILCATWLFIFLFILGWGIKSIGNDGINLLMQLQHVFVALIPYITVSTSLIFIHAVTLEKGDDSKFIIKSQTQRLQYTSIAFILLFVGLAFGFYLDDPVVTAASAVTIPFAGVALLFKAVRHMQRAKVYPVFITAMFVSLREPWLLIPVGILFYGLRFYHYFRYEIIYPTFGVDFDD